MNPARTPSAGISTPPPAQCRAPLCAQYGHGCVKNFTLTLWNIYSFFVTLRHLDGWNLPPCRPFPKDKAPGAKRARPLAAIVLNTLVRDVTKPTRPMTCRAPPVRSSLCREPLHLVPAPLPPAFWKSESDTDKQSAYATLYTAL